MYMCACTRVHHICFSVSVIPAPLACCVALVSPAAQLGHECRPFFLKKGRGDAWGGRCWSQKDVGGPGAF